MIVPLLLVDRSFNFFGRFLAERDAAKGRLGKSAQKAKKKGATLLWLSSCSLDFFFGFLIWISSLDFLGIFADFFSKSPLPPL